MIAIDTSTWGEFVVTDLFEHIESGREGSVGKLMDGDIPYIAASYATNGLARFVSDPDGSRTSDGNCVAMIVDGNGGIGRNTYQPVPFVGSINLRLGYHPRLNVYTGLFLVACLNKSIERYGYNFQWKRTGDAFAQETVFLPTTTDGHPDWNYMQSAMERQIADEENRLHSLLAITATPPRQIDTSSWSEFRLDELFNLVKGARLKSTDRLPGEIPYVGASRFNNGITHYISNNEHLHPGGVLTVCYNGPVGTTFYQPTQFWATDDVNVLYPKTQMPMEVLLFIAPMIEQIGANYAYTDKWKLEDMAASKIRLPVTASGAPDFGNMKSQMSDLLLRKESSLDLLKAIIPSTAEKGEPA